MFCYLGQFIAGLFQTSLLTYQIGSLETICSTTECTSTAEKYRARMNPSVEKCEDFYESVCGHFGGENDKILKYADYVDIIYERNDQINEKILEFFDSLKDNPSSTSIFKKIRFFYTQCMDDDRGEAASTVQIQKQLKFFEFTMQPPFLDTSSHLKISLMELLARMHASSLPDSGFLFKLSVVSGPHSHNENVLQIETALDTIFKARNAHQDMDDLMFAHINELVHHLYVQTGTTLSNKQIPAIDRRVLAVTEFLIALKEIPNEPYDEDILSKELNVNELQKIIDKELGGGEIQVIEGCRFTYFRHIWEDCRAVSLESSNFLLNCVAFVNIKHQVKPYEEGGYIFGTTEMINFAEYLESLYAVFGQSAKQITTSSENLILLTNPIEFQKTLKLLRKTPRDVLVQAMWWIILQTLGENISYRFIDNYDYIFLPIPRKIKCLKWIHECFPLFVVHVLAVQTNSVTLRKKVEEMVAHIKKAFLYSFKRLTWSDSKTSKAAQKKLENIVTYIGFSDSILNVDTVQKAYQQVDFAEINFLATLISMVKNERKHELLQLIDTDMAARRTHPDQAEIGVHYDPRKLCMVVPISLFGFPYYNLGLEVLNYAALGSYIAHVMEHAFDLESGSKIDAKRRQNFWWSEKSKIKYQRLMKCFERLYSGIYVKKAKRNVNGQLTACENMADTNGFNISRAAYVMYVQKYGPEEKLPELSNMSAEQLFTVAFANMFCAKQSRRSLRHQLANEFTPPNSVRVNGVAMNSMMFTKAWSCSNDQSMVSRRRCEIWK